MRVKRPVRSELSREARDHGNAAAYVRVYVREGRLTKPDLCEGCRRSARVYAHHADYDDPLEFEWLCDRCHGERHGKVRIGPRG